jgi:hypothetical protein
MAAFTAVTDEDLDRARRDPVFRQQLLTDSLEVLLVRLNRMRAASKSMDKISARQIRESVDLAVRLSDLLQEARTENEPHQAA